VLEDGDEGGGHHKDNAPEVQKVGQGEDLVTLQSHVKDVAKKVSGSLKSIY